MIPEETLKSWTNQGSVVGSQKTYNSIKSALDVEPLSEKNIEIYLQGSYRNHTNIRGNSDVDIVVQLNNTFASNKNELPSEQLEAFNDTFPDATYSWKEFKQDVKMALINKYGSQRVSEGDKSLKISGNENYLAADVVPCFQYRKYSYFYSKQISSCEKGIAFWTSNTNQKIINYPKQHFNNGANKNSEIQTSGLYKPIVRMYKNLISRMKEEHCITNSEVSSYHLECLLYNVPDSLFGYPLDLTFIQIAKWIYENEISDLNKLKCQNGLLKLFGNEQTQWNIDKFISFREAFVKYILD